eukprot:gnl/TRDRNA2_/TRDRNA2_193983_c0_seq1.p1 gnl/TRDRNA2_/TRDRNA2_193983_c0~~gnl/TRDRNA2_/TRDRNA2_193983_c0_seq1.p1  ORF type:complete len:171 (+),score=23.75 gnl/TRDRNA2_/TRDRNA2_193983_c0_seq1:38-514(+)
MAGEDTPLRAGHRRMLSAPGGSCTGKTIAEDRSFQRLTCRTSSSQDIREDRSVRAPLISGGASASGTDAIDQSAYGHNRASPTLQYLQRSSQEVVNPLDACREKVHGRWGFRRTPDGWLERLTAPHMIPVWIVVAVILEVAAIVGGAAFGKAYFREMR